MSNILVVTGSVRPNSANEKVVPLVVNEVDKQGAEVTIADLKELNLPFFNSPWSPTAPEFTITDESVQKWTDLVAAADGVIFVTPEYNHTLTPVQLNAIDWIGKEWTDKHISFVGYGWTSGAGQAQATAREAFETVLSAHVSTHPTNLFFMKDLNPDGSVLDEEAVTSKIAATVTELLKEI